MWTTQELDTLVDLSIAKTFKEIVPILGRTHDSVRWKAFKLGIKSPYSPAIESKKEEVRKKISTTLQGIPTNEWGGYKETTNALIRKSCAYKKWRTAVFKRDKYRCTECGAKGVYLHADHIKMFAFHPKLRFKVSNGRTLCVKCHKGKETTCNNKHVCCI